MLMPCFFIASAGELSPIAIPLSMLVVFVSAKLLAELFERLASRVSWERSWPAS